jgi:hypothetical protein
MTTDDVPQGSQAVAWFDYFVLRLSRRDAGPEQVSGMVERLGSGEKRRFDTGEQLIELVKLWSGRMGESNGALKAGKERSQ